MLTSDNLERKLSLDYFFNYFTRVNLPALSFVLAIAICLLELQPISAQVLSKSPKQTRTTPDNHVPQHIIVTKFDVVGSTIFSQSELNQSVKSYLNRPLTLPELFQARSSITKLYTDQGYVSSGAYIPPQKLNDGTVQITVLEGKLEEIKVSGTKHLSTDYVSARIETAAGKPLNVNSLLSALQLLRLDPLIDNVSAELSAGIRPGTNLLEITIKEADAFNVATNFNNSRSPSVGTNQRSIGINHGNLLGFGDRFTWEYANTKGSNGFDLAYGFPVNSENGTIKAVVGVNSNHVIEDPFTAIDIESKSRYYELSLRQPILLKPTQEFALGISFTRSESETFLMNDKFFLSRGANEEGETRISAVRLFQEFIKRNEQEVFALRSQFSFGIDAFNSTINNNGEPDSTFVSWRGQSQWTRRLDEDFLLLLRGDIQISGGSLVPLEQFRIGGFNSIRGYRQDLSLGDNGLFVSTELRIPVWRFKKFDGLLQVAPFFDLGTVWNSDDVEIANATLPALGIGLNLVMGDRFNARLDWGIPLVQIETKGNSLQEDGVHFSIDYSFF
ncbi:ShlB/FhaC/HecB family hemolysin secretion/activation protein [Pleurocapsa sp. CCALA 161]|uniref:ShlB/FhaC/HecB family hemolysin secretion/activation protein n=1 Tax=Pleurocapsa sp. CCALA 161 TaxID=2107688 RepID=UPI000D06A489|nr:ShlB/FhaC/HecB family hemolysin secretion/activation protein [Pleurocapsa sp. CCALA 161]PSB10838.1 ShlB/FhaC/HecB family hemolysin secretion/activation protein [Pleurocapsa sp. CCALA 161]